VFCIGKNGHKILLDRLFHSTVQEYPAQEYERLSHSLRKAGKT